MKQDTNVAGALSQPLADLLEFEAFDVAQQQRLATVSAHLADAPCQGILHLFGVRI